MHFLAYLTFNKDKASTPEEAMGFASQVLHDEGFVAQEGTRWGGGGIADWLVIGGRWNGHISFTRLCKSDHKIKYLINTLLYLGKGNDIDKHLKKSFPEHDYVKAGGYNRRNEDNSDNAQIVDEFIYNNILKEYEGKYQDDNGENFWDYEINEVDRETFIGKKWIVVFDYHM